MESHQCLLEGLVLRPSEFGPDVRQTFQTWSLAAVFLNSNLCPKFFRAAIPPIVPFRVRFDNNNTIRTLELSLQAAGTDG